MLSFGESVVAVALGICVGIPFFQIATRGVSVGRVLVVILLLTLVTIIGAGSLLDSSRPPPVPLDWRSTLTSKDFKPSHPDDPVKSQAVREARIAKLKRSADSFNALQQARHDEKVRSARAVGIAFPITAILGAALGFLGGSVKRRVSGVARPNIKTFADIDGLVGMLMAACEDAQIKSSLDQLLEMPDERRKEALRALIDHLRARRAPSNLIDAFICLQDDLVAEKAYAAIFQCWKKPQLPMAKLA